MIKLLISTVLIFQVMTAFAYTTNSLTWQKLALEEKIQRKYNSTLSTLLKDNQYLVEVETEMNEPPAPNFGDSGPKTGPRVSDANMADSRGDYIAFSKMGLEVPVVDKFLDEDRTKLMNLYRFNETYDLFKNLAGLKVTIFISEKVPADLHDIVKNIVTSMKMQVSGIKPQVKFETIAMEWTDPAELKRIEEAKKPKPEIKKVQEEPKIWTKDWIEWASRWGNAVGLILFALITAYLALSIFKQWKAFMEAQAAKNENANKQGEDLKDDKKETMAVNAAPQALNQEEDVASTTGFDRFKQCLGEHTEEAISMVRSWLNEGEEHDLLALRAIAQQATAEQMELLMSGLSELQRDSWKGLLGKHLEAAELSAASKHIFQEVIKSFLVPSRIKDGELLNLIMELNAKSTGEFFTAHKNQVGMLMNLLNPGIIGKILAVVDDRTADEWLSAGSDFPANKMDEKVPELKEALKSFKDANAPSPFAHRILAMILTAPPSREGTLYKALSKSGNAGMIMEVAKKNFPSELVLDLPAPLLKEIIQSYPMSKRIDLLHSRPEDIRVNLLDMVAENGSPARDMLDMELENIKRDAARSASIESRADEIWQDFVKNTRITLSKNASYNSTTLALIKEWSQQLGGGLKAIKGGKAA